MAQTATVRDQRPNEWRLPEGLNGAQMQEVHRAVLQITEQLKLRQWCVEKAIAAAEGKTGDPVKVARDIYGFIAPQLPTVIESQGE